jgi:hypothetical protein
MANIGKCDLRNDYYDINQLKYFNKNISKNIKNQKSIIYCANIFKNFKLNEKEKFIVNFQTIKFIIYQEKDDVIIFSAKTNAIKLKNIFEVFNIKLILLP